MVSRDDGDRLVALDYLELLAGYVLVSDAPGRNRTSARGLGSRSTPSRGVPPCPAASHHLESIGRSGNGGRILAADILDARAHGPRNSLA
jgi:hypothetical protein